MVNRTYILHKVAREIPTSGYNVDWDNKAKWEPCILNTNYAIEAQKEVDFLKEKGINAQVVILIKHPCDNNYKPDVAIIIENFMGEYTLYKDSCCFGTDTVDDYIEYFINKPYED